MPLAQCGKSDIRQNKEQQRLSRPGLVPSTLAPMHHWSAEWGNQPGEGLLHAAVGKEANR